MKRWMALLLTLILVLTMNMQTAYALQVNGITWMNVTTSAQEPVAYCQLRAHDSVGTGVVTDAENFNFVGMTSDGTGNVDLPRTLVPAENNGHILVVDASAYYYGFKDITDENIRQIVTTYLKGQSEGERFKFVVAQSKKITESKFMGMDDALHYVEGITLEKDKSSQILNALYRAFQIVAAPEEGEPMFNSVFALVDPDLESNQMEGAHTFPELVQMRMSIPKSFDLTVSTIYRQRYLDSAVAARKTGIQNGLETLRSFAQDVGGAYLQVYHANNSELNVSELTEGLYMKPRTKHAFAVDLTPLAGHLGEGDRLQNVQLTAYCAAGDTLVSGNAELKIDTRLLPVVTPEPTPEITPVPGPAPVVAAGQSDTVAKKAIFALYNLGYLADTKHSGFDDDCFFAYLAFCDINQIDPQEGVLEGIYETGYQALTSDQAIARPVETPVPTATPTPAPTIPPEGYKFGDVDTETSGGFITAVQSELKRLNCFAAEANVGCIDQATLDAVNTYCEVYGWTNDRTDGVPRLLCEEILRNGPNRTPFVPPEPDLREKALAFLQEDVFDLGGFPVQMWMLCAASAVLLFGIIVVVLVIRSHKEAPAPPTKPRNAPVPDMPSTDPIPAGGCAPQPAYSPPHRQADNGELTTPKYSSKPVTLNIDYAGRRTIQKVELYSTGCCVIGRRNSTLSCDVPLDSQDKDASRKHAALYAVGAQVYLTDLGSVNGTRLNGTVIHGVKENEKRAGGRLLKSGDVVEISRHRITIIF